MRKVRCKSYEDAVAKLQAYVDQTWNIWKGRIYPDEKKRRWLKAIPEDSYGEKQYRVELWVLEGSPVKQIVIVNHLMKSIYCHDSTLYKEALFTWEDDLVYGQT